MKNILNIQSRSAKPSIQRTRQTLREPKKTRAAAAVKTYTTYSQHTKAQKFVCTKK
nr:MAG TPA: hypothetical protein [Caudoviricetes sp.]